MILPILPGLINFLFFYDNPGFVSISFLPYILIPLYASVISGVYKGYLSLFWEILLLVFFIPFFAGIRSGGEVTFTLWLEAIKPALFLALPLELILILIFGMSFSSVQNQKQNIQRRLSDLSIENLQLKKLSHAQAEVSRELEERVYRQQEAITTLYARIQKMYTLDLDRALDNLLETIQLFSRSESISIGRVSEENQEITTVKTLGDSAEIPPVVPMDSSLEGWVLRNHRFFSVRMVLEYENLSRLDQGRSVLIFPLQINRKPWGIINIHQIPFVKYNQYTEQLLEIIVHLAENALTRAIEYEALVGGKCFDSETGLLDYTHFLKVIDEEIIRLKLGKSTFSFVLLEILNPVKDDEISLLLTKIQNIIRPVAGGRGEMFYYQNPNQLAVILPALDEDGASLFCLEILEKVSSLTWKEGKEVQNIDLAVGFSHSRREDSRESLTERAQQMLNAQVEMSR